METWGPSIDDESRCPSYIAWIPLRDSFTRLPIAALGAECEVRVKPAWDESTILVELYTVSAASDFTQATGPVFAGFAVYVIVKLSECDLSRPSEADSTRSRNQPTEGY